MTPNTPQHEGFFLTFLSVCCPPPSLKVKVGSFFSSHVLLCPCKINTTSERLLNLNRTLPNVNRWSSSTFGKFPGPNVKSGSAFGKILAEPN
jgi:hypothetical protein